MTEIIVAMAIAAGPLLISVNLVRSNAAGARFNRERATARMVLIDLSTLLLGETVDGLRQRLDPADPGRLEEVLDARIAGMPAAAKKPYAEEIAPFRKKITGKLEENIDPQTPGLARLTLTAKLSAKQDISIRLLFRPEARERFREIAEPPPDAGQTGSAL